MPTISSKNRKANVKQKSSADIFPEANIDLDGLLSNNASGNSKIVPSGKSLFVPYLRIRSAHTYTVEESAQLVSVETLTVEGTLVVNGEVKVL